ncbi:ABC transporter ATP-binding protein [Microbacterium sp. NPDC087589]|uniref:ABC transporter ATP-binding protein n=1 Tax=Microbacterium sp. NPDC087589 TaxID=3364191 RepID=UPI0037FF4BE9
MSHSYSQDRSVTGSRLVKDWRRAFALLWQTSPGGIIGLIAVTVVVGTLPALQVQFLASAVQAATDAVVNGTGAEQLPLVLQFGVLLGGVMVAMHLLSVLNQYISQVVQFKLSAVVSERIMIAGTEFELADYENAASYDKLQRASRESSGGGIQQLFESVLDITRELITLVTVSIVIFSWNPWIALLVLLAPIPAAIANMWFGAISYQIEYGRAPERRLLSYLQYLTTTDHSFKEVRLFGLGPHFVSRYRELVQKFLAVDRSIARRQGLALAGLGLLSVVGAAGAIVFALTSALQTGAIGQLAGYLQALTTIQSSVTTLLMSVGMLFELSLFLGNLFTVIDRDRAGDTKPHGTLAFPTPIRQGFSFEGVSFSYPGTDREVLHSVDLTIPATGCVALVGSNGSGKTTIVKLLTRMYEPSAGRILLDGVPIDEYDLEDYHRNVGVIFQDFIKYEMTVRQNIGFGRLEAMDDDERLRSAANDSGIAKEITGMDDGYDTMLGRHFVEGRQLSGGQWQRIALARAFMRNAPVVVLDEPTAAIDAETEQQIFEQVRKVATNSCSLLIAHRFSTVKLADEVVVLEGGKVLERGNHDELMETGGRYSRLFTLQAAPYLPETTTHTS